MSYRENVTLWGSWKDYQYKGGGCWSAGQRARGTVFPETAVRAGDAALSLCRGLPARMMMRLVKASVSQSSSASPCTEAAAPSALKHAFKVKN